MVKLSLFILFTFGLFFLGPAIPAVAQFNPLEEACDNTNTSSVSGSSTCVEAEQQGSTNPITGPGGIIAKIARIITILVGVASVIMLIYGGFTFVTSGGSPIGQRSGDASKIGKAKSTVTFAIVGLVVAALSWTIISLVTDRLL